MFNFHPVTPHEHSSKYIKTKKSFLVELTYKKISVSDENNTVLQINRKQKTVDEISQVIFKLYKLV